MKNLGKVILLLAVASVLNGCAISNKTTKQPIENTLYEKAVQGKAYQAGLSNIETLWLPARYSHSGESAFYINGSQYIAPGGHSDVLGFIVQTNGNYLVAVRQQANRLYSVSSQGVSQAVTSTVSTFPDSVVFYEVTKPGKTLKTLGKIEDANSVVITLDAIYARKSTGDGLSSYLGFDKKSQSIAGPQNVSYATPTPNRGWFSVKESSFWQSGQKEIRYLSTDAKGATTELVQWKKGRGFSDVEFVNTTAAFINQVPVTDSVRTGRVVKLVRDYSGTTQSFRNYTGWVYDLSWKQPNRHANRNGDFGIRYGKVSNLSAKGALDAARRTILFNEAGTVYAASQSSKSVFSNLDYMLVDVLAEEPYQSRQSIFRLASGKRNTMRKVFAGNSADVSLNAFNDAYALITPQTTVLVLANNVDDEAKIKAYDVSHGAMIASADIEKLLTQYGINR